MIELTVENIAAVSARLRALGWTDKNIDSLESAGEGNMNRTLRARLDDGSGMILKQSVDHVAKYPQIAAPIERTGVEAEFYAAIKPYSHLVARTPALIGYDSRNHILGIQDLGESTDFTDLYVGNGDEQTLSTKTLGSILSWLSALHAIAPPAGFPDNMAMRLLNHAHIFDLPLQPSTYENPLPAPGPETLRLANDIVSQEALLACTRDLGNRYLDRTHTDARGSLLHGDFYPASWLRSGNDAAYIIDPEFAFVGPPEFDVGVFVAHLVFCGYSRAEAAATLEHYTPPRGFDGGLVERFAGIELLRRILGVAQLPLVADDATRAGWLSTAVGLMVGD